MAKKLTVILGAGASASVFNSHPNTLKSPIADELFNQDYRVFLERYPLAEILGNTLVRKLRQNNSTGLEKLLKYYNNQLEKGKDTPPIREFLQMRPYFRDLFGSVTNRFSTATPYEFSNLVNAVTEANIKEVLFLTLNYDNLLETVLSRIEGLGFSKEEDYINRKWSLVKLHGSINWAKKFKTEYRPASISTETYVEFLRTVSLPLDLETAFLFMNFKATENNNFYDNYPIYPALTVPVYGKYEFNCPESHLKRAKTILSECKNYLIIGTSGKDKDLMDLLKDNVRDGNVLLVGREKKNTVSVKRRFESSVPQFKGKIKTYLSGNGFTGFVDQELEKYIKHQLV